MHIHAPAPPMPSTPGAFTPATDPLTGPVPPPLRPTDPLGGAVPPPLPPTAPGIAPARPVEPSPSAPLGTTTSALLEQLGNMASSISFQARGLVAHFDTDHSGAIDLSRREFTRTEQKPYGLLTASIERLATFADQIGDRNGKVTAQEIERVMQLFDTGKASWTEHGDARAYDGRLEDGESMRFSQAFGPDVHYHSPVPAPVSPIAPPPAVPYATEVSR